jgi:hypothetical protein
LGCKISSEEEKDITSEVSTFLIVLGILNSVLKPNLVHRQSQMNVYNVLAIPSLLCGYEIWTLKQRDIRRLKTAEMNS